MNPSPHTLTQAIKQHALDLGFDRAGIARAEPLDGSHLRRWLAAGHHGRMAYMTNHLDLRLDPGLLLPGARSILVGAINYFAPDPDPVADAGLIARYARGDDYHTVLRRKLKKLLQRIRELKPGAQGSICVDSAPLLKKAGRSGPESAGRAKTASLFRRGSDPGWSWASSSSTASSSPTCRLRRNAANAAAVWMPAPRARWWLPASSMPGAAWPVRPSKIPLPAPGLRSSPHEWDEGFSAAISARRSAPTTVPGRDRAWNLHSHRGRGAPTSRLSAMPD